MLMCKAIPACEEEGRGIEAEPGRIHKIIGQDTNLEAPPIIRDHDSKRDLRDHPHPSCSSDR